MRVRSGRGAGEGGGSTRAALRGQPRPRAAGWAAGTQRGHPSPLSSGGAGREPDIPRPAAGKLKTPRSPRRAPRPPHVGTAVSGGPCPGSGAAGSVCGNPGAPPAHKFRRGKPVRRRRTGTPKYRLFPARRRPAGRCWAVPAFGASGPGRLPFLLCLSPLRLAGAVQPSGGHSPFWIDHL